MKLLMLENGKVFEKKSFRFNIYCFMKNIYCKSGYLYVEESYISYVVSLKLCKIFLCMCLKIISLNSYFYSMG